MICSFVHSPPLPLLSHLHLPLTLPPTAPTSATSRPTSPGAHSAEPALPAAPRVELFSAVLALVHSACYHLIHHPPSFPAPLQVQAFTAPPIIPELWIILPFFEQPLIGIPPSPRAVQECTCCVWLCAVAKILNEDMNRRAFLTCYAR